VSERIRIINHKGIKVLFVDNSGLTTSEIVSSFPRRTKLAIENKIVRTFIDLTNTTTDDRIKQAAHDSQAEILEALGQNWIASTGIRGIQKILANAAVKGQYFAANQEEALDWLVQQHSN